MSDYLDGIFNSDRVLSDVAYRLNDLAKCFYGVGNETVANELIEMSADIFKCKDVISSSVGNELNRQNKEVWSGVGDILSSCMLSDKDKLENKGG